MFVLSAKIEVLSPSRCLPLGLRTRTLLDAVGTSRLCQKKSRHYRADSGSLAQPAAPYESSLLLDALYPDRTEAGVFAADVCFNLLLFVFECLDRVDIGKL